MKPIHRSLLLALVSLLVSCSGVTGTVNLKLPDKLGGAVVPITIQPDK